MPEKKATTVSAREMDWPSVLFQMYLHALGIYGLYLCVVSAKFLTVIFAIALILISIIGITSGAHRLYAHRTFEAHWSIRLFVVLSHSLAGVGSIYDWVLTHRMHHKYYGTDKDPYNHSKGFIYSHFTSSIVKRPPDFEKLCKEVDMRDVEVDPFVWLQKTFYWVFFIVFCLLLPINAPVEYWDESLLNSVFIVGFVRLAILNNVSALVHSSMLIWGLKPGDKLMAIPNTLSLLYKLFFKMPKSHGTIVIDSNGLHAMYPVKDNSIFLVTKSYWPNYHYQLPWDWKSGEFGNYDSGYPTFVIKIWKEMGLIKSMKTVASESVREALHKVATKKSTIDDALKELKKVSETKAITKDLCYHH